jgi:thiamine biosynthesis lipoprotein
VIAASDRLRTSTALMGTTVTVEVIGGPDAQPVIDRALEWFRVTEACCSRFDSSSEVAQLLSRVGEAVHVSPMLMGAIGFALALAEDTGGAFDPTIGHLLESRGDNIEYRTRAVVRTAITSEDAPTWRDVKLDATRGTITLLRPLMLDLGAIAKGLAIDLAVRELRTVGNFAIDAGGDLYLGGTTAMREPWSVGIRHPRESERLLETLCVSDMAVCTTGDYERRFVTDGGVEEHHIVDARTRATATRCISATVVSSSAMVADALSTAAFILGGRDGIALLDRHGVDGLIVSSDMERHETSTMGHHRAARLT